MVAPGGFYGANLTFVDPLLERGIADAQDLGGFTGREKFSRLHFLLNTRRRRLSSGLEHYAFQSRPQFANIRFNVQSLLRELPLAAALNADLGVLELMSGQHGNDIGAVLDLAGTHQLVNAGHGRRRGRLAPDAVFGQHGFSLKNLLVADGFAEAIGGTKRAKSLSPVHGIADTNGGSFGARLNGSHLIGAAGDHAVKRAGPFGLNDDETRLLIDQAELLQLRQAFSDRGDIAQISAGENQVIGNAPIALLKDFEDDGFLALETEGVERIYKVQAKFVGEIAKHTEGLIEVIAHFDDDRAEFQGLSQLGGGDFPKRNKNDGFHTGARGVGGHGGGGIAGGGASRDAAAQNGCLRDAGGHAQILERAGRVIALMLDGKLDAGPFAGAVHFDQWRAALGEADYFGAVRDKRKDLAEAPDAALVSDGGAHFSQLPELTERNRIELRKVVLNVQKTATGWALMFFGVEGVTLPAGLLYALQKGGGHGIWPMGILPQRLFQTRTSVRSATV